MTRITLTHILIIAAAAFAVGAIVDHGFLAIKSEPLPKPVELVDAPSVSGSSTADASQEMIAHSSASNAKTKKSLDSILAERDPRQRMSDIEAFINGLKPAEYADALKRIRKIPGNSDRELASRLLVSRWVQSDPDAALEFAVSNRGYEYVADAVFEQAAAADLQAALDRAKSLPSGDLRYMALRGVLSFMADTDPAGALQLALTLGDYPGNEPLSSVVYRQWATNDPQAAALQASQDNAGGGWRSPVGQVVRTWAGQDPTAAANWALSLTDPETQARSISQVMRQWTREDLTAATNWVNTLPAGATHDTAVAALAFSMAGTDPQSAINWAGNIVDATARNNALQRISREVMWRDPTNGNAILQAAGVPANLIPAPGNRGPRGP